MTRVIIFVKRAKVKSVFLLNQKEWAAWTAKGRKIKIETEKGKKGEIKLMPFVLLLICSMFGAVFNKKVNLYEQD